MSSRDLKTVERRFHAELNNGKATGMAAMDEMVDPEVILHSATGEDVFGLKDLKKRTSEHSDAFPDTHITIDCIIVEGEKAVVRYTVACTHRRALMGIPATNKKLKMSIIEIHRFVNGKVVEAWEMSDTLEMMQQLGVVPKTRR